MDYTSKPKPDLLQSNPQEYFRLQKQKQRKKALTIIAIVIPVLVAIGFAFVYGISSFMKSSDAYKTAITAIESKAEIKAWTGGITGYGFMPTGTIQTTNDSGHAELTIAVKGAKKDVDVYVALTKQNGAWQIQQMEVVE
ncbi:hypothetical protein FMM05_13060 [Flavobacterium zepuense]|uniref:Cytochrome oxidase complex assembly protein 1 n=1 Tax=Flavobacterium zepuense TaxID=2593302 RepID=A0A552UZD9_9FLAO|nr:cytochrome c oxidase assembly factor Coa1 family protein [Flavobacterium zepuense]TRW23585.1 hypothetical protein FMM05_13060 [Flavobacterium zepuense]